MDKTFFEQTFWIDISFDKNQTKPTKLNLPNQTYETKPTKPNLPSQTYQNKYTKPNLPYPTFQRDKIAAPKVNSLAKLEDPSHISQLKIL